MRILVDMDGIVTDTLPFWLKRIYELTGVRAYPDDITKWAMNENSPLNTLNPSDIFDILNEEEFNLSLPQMNDATFYLKKLHDAGHDVSIVTARYGTNCMPETLVWLKEMMPWFNVEKKTIFCYDKHRITTDILVDDKAETLIAYQKEHPYTELITIDYPYNKHAPQNTHRVQKNGREWEQIERIINDISNNT